MGIGNNPPRWGTAQVVAYTASSATATAVGSQTYAVRLVSTTACHVHIAQPAVAASATADTYLAGVTVPEYVCVSPGDIITVVRDSVSGNLSIVELTY